eukprot:4308521-Prymnesium_polylepis.1
MAACACSHVSQSWDALETVSCKITSCAVMCGTYAFNALHLQRVGRSAVFEIRWTLTGWRSLSL